MTGLAVWAIPQLYTWAGGAKAADPLSEPVCGFTAGPHYYLESSAVRQGLRVELLANAAQAGQPCVLRFTITQQPRNVPVDKLQIEHEKFMHIIGVRKDLSQFFHVHPVRTAPGIWEAPLTFAEGGEYKFWSEVKYLGTAYSFGQPWLTVTGPATEVPMPAGKSDEVEVAQCVVKFVQTGPLASGQTNELKFVVRDKAGKPLELENFLGTPMHLFIVSQDVSSCLHAHPQGASALGGMVRFSQPFPNPGTYKLFAQFRPKRNHLGTDQALLAEFTLAVKP